MKTITAASIIGLALIVTTSLATPVMAGHEHNQDTSYDEHNYKKHGPKKHRNRNRGHKNKFYDYARVVKVKPIYKQVKVGRPQKQCWDSHRERPINRHASYNSQENMIVGSIIGGVIGHHLGKGRTKGATTAVGALIGAAVGHENSRHRVDSGKTRTEHRKRCETHVEYRYENQADGYRVTYRYRGETFHARMRHRPGKRVRIKVQVSLLD